MNTLKLSLLCLGGLLAVTGVAYAKDASAGDKPKPALQLKITVPPNVDMLAENDIAEALASNVREAFRRRGYDAGIEEILVGDQTEDGRPALILNLVRWRMGPSGFVDCTFTAALRSRDGAETALGIFSASDVAMNPRNRQNLGDTFENAAQQAADDLWRKLSESEALPGLIPSPTS